MQKILVIEDNKDVRENIAEILELSNYEVLTAENGKSGAETALARLPDLIICDIMMPELDGYGVLHLLNKHEETAGVPFIFLTAKSERDDFRKGMEMGADDYITKPFKGIELLNAVESRLKKMKHLRQTLHQDLKNMDTLFKQTKSPDLEKLTSEDREICRYPKKHLLFAENQRPKFVFYIMKGKVRTYLIHEGGKEFTSHLYGKGDFFGFLPILKDSQYNDNAQVLEDAEIMLIPRKDFLHLIQGDMQVSKKFIKLIAHNTSSNEENLLNLAYNSLRKKVSFGLLKLIKKYKTSENSTVELDLSRENMASAAGVATESLIRTLSDFRAEKLIDIRGGKVVILNEKKLKDLPF